MLVCIMRGLFLYLIITAKDYRGEESEPMLNHLFKALVRYPMLDIYHTNKIDNHKELSD